jgi:uncharacterized membrane protein YqaE (UPF0057 family)
MKTKTTCHSIALLALIFLFSSCSVTISKRHYRSGYYVDIGSGKPSEPKLREKLSSPIPVEPTANVTMDTKNPVPENVLTPVNATQSLSASSTKKKNRKSPALTTYYTSTDAYYVEPEKNVREYEYLPYSIESESPAQPVQTSSDVPFWAIIVFCILIPPLGVGLKFGIVDKFWICLLLTLLFWLPGAIYALIVVTQ